MKRIYIIGIVASGKTTLAKKLSKQLKITHYELDCIVYHESLNNRFKRTTEQQIDVIRSLSGDWIIEGTYRESSHVIMDLADQIIFLDTPLYKRKLRIFLRYIKQKLHLEKCYYRSSLTMLKQMYKWTNEFETNRATFDHMLTAYQSKLIVIKHTHDLF